MLHSLQVCQAAVAAVTSAFALPPWSLRAKIQSAALANHVSSAFLGEVFHCTFLWTNGAEGTEILNASGVYLKQE